MRIHLGSIALVFVSSLAYALSLSACAFDAPEEALSSEVALEDKASTDPHEGAFAAQAAGGRDAKCWYLYVGPHGIDPILDPGPKKCVLYCELSDNPGVCGTSRPVDASRCERPTGFPATCTEQPGRFIPRTYECSNDFAPGETVRIPMGNCG